jgi:hypothetical protein
VTRDSDSDTGSDILRVPANSLGRRRVVRLTLLPWFAIASTHVHAIVSSASVDIHAVGRRPRPSYDGYQYGPQLLRACCHGPSWCRWTHHGARHASQPRPAGRAWWRNAASVWRWSNGRISARRTGEPGSDGRDAARGQPSRSRLAAHESCPAADVPTAAAPEPVYVPYFNLPSTSSLSIQT